MEEVKQRKLVIKVYHITAVENGEKIAIEGDRLTISDQKTIERCHKTKYIKQIKVEIITPRDHDRYTNSIMDIIPISTKVLGKLGEGITHTLTGVYIMLTGVDEKGVPVAEFGSSQGNLQEKLKLNRAGTPAQNDIIINVDVTLKEGEGTRREAILESHSICDEFIQEIREILKKQDPKNYTEKHEYFDTIRKGKYKVAIVKQIAGQGAMYDNYILPQEPSGFKGGRSIIDMGNVPVILSPNEYRDGAVRAMT